MRKLFLTSLFLTSTFAFAVNPKNIDTRKLLAAEKVSKMKAKATPCADSYGQVLNQCLNLGMSFEKADAIATGAFVTCMALLYPN